MLQCRFIRKWPNPKEGGRGNSWEFLLGVCCLVLQILTLFQTKKCNFPYPFSDLEEVIKQHSCSLRSEHQHKDFLKAISNSHIMGSFLIHLEPLTDMFKHHRSSLENYTQFQTKMGKVYTCFQTKNGTKAIPFGAAHIYMAYIREYAPPPDLM